MKGVRYYHYQVLNSDLDFGLRALGSDEDVRGFSKYVGEGNRVMNVYVEHDSTSVYTYFCSPSKVRIEEVTDEELMAIDLANASKRRLCLDFHEITNETGQSSGHQPQIVAMLNVPNFDPYFGDINGGGGDNVDNVNVIDVGVNVDEGNVNDVVVNVDEGNVTDVGVNVNNVGLMYIKVKRRIVEMIVRIV
ncbi:uncharacterized protein LOC143602141 [Bidens hawaiensis]|uniref:uncharacterized protein LOC143602141 n=1 Tax=Bidens hawaiensis TaxID=980011 RepID=UPI0040493208